ncbi:MAG: divalent-cation tolerance protein CutA [Acidobacteriota bacterium]
MTDKIIVFSTCGSAEEAGRIARELVEKRVAACVNILTGIASVYRWKGAVEEAAEVLLVIKTTRELFPRLRDEIRALHSYEVPEIVAMPVVDGLDDYLAWIADSVK